MNKKPQKQPGWLNKKDMAASLGISVTAFDKWKVQPTQKIGREQFYTVSDVVENRVGYELDKITKSNNREEKISCDIDYEAEEAALKREQRITAQTKNAILEGRSVPTEMAREVIAKILGKTGAVLDALPLSIKREFPDIDHRVIGKIKQAIIKHQNECSKMDDFIDEVIDAIIAEAEKKL